MRLEAWDAGTAAIGRNWSEGVEIFVVRGELSDENGVYGEGTWLRLPPGSSQAAASDSGCEIYIKEGGFAYLKSA